MGIPMQRIGISIQRTLNTVLTRGGWALFGFGVRLLLAALKIGVAIALVLSITAWWLYDQYGRDLPDPYAIRQHQPFETTRIYASDGRTLLYELVDPYAGRRTVVPFERIPQALKDATIAVEDAGYYHHAGVDLRGVLRAAWLNYESGEIISGGSTITQQLVRNLLLPPETRGRDLPIRALYERKLREAMLAFRVNREYSKDQILNLYLNEVYYGAQAYGVEAAAQTYFGKHVWELNLAEITLIAGLPQSPTRFNPFTDFEQARARQRITLDLMVKQGYLTPHQADAAFAEPLVLVPPVVDLQAPHFVFYVRDLLEQRYGPDRVYRGGLRVVTSLDLHWQAVAEQIVERHLAELRPRNATNAGAVLLAPDGRILAMVGSAGYANSDVDGQVNVTLALRQPGSALKPFIYAAAMQRGWTPATVIWDEPTTFVRDGTLYQPRNYDGNWHGPQRLRMALANSLNIPAVKALEFVGIEAFVQLANDAGITSLNDPSRYGLAMALGSTEVRLLELTVAYNTIRNGGYQHPPVAILSVSNNRGELLEQATELARRQIFGVQGEQIAYQLTSILSDNQARRYMFGANNVMELPDNRPAAVKTGTSNEWRDAWAVGYTTDLTVGVWVGNSDNSPMQEIAGVNGAGVIWRDLMLTYHRELDLPVRQFSPPSGIEQRNICAATGAPASPACPVTATEWFRAGTAPDMLPVTYQERRVGADGTCLAMNYTPSYQVRTITYAVYPPDFQEWATQQGIPQPPSEPCPPPDPDAYVLNRLDTSIPSVAFVGEQIAVTGIARGDYTLEVGAGAYPATWQTIVQGSGLSEAGLLAVWQTGGVPAGVYTLRLQVIAADGSRTTDTHLVTLTE